MLLNVKLPWMRGVVQTDTLTGQLLQGFTSMAQYRLQGNTQPHMLEQTWSVLLCRQAGSTWQQLENKLWQLTAGRVQGASTGTQGLARAAMQ